MTITLGILIGIVVVIFWHKVGSHGLFKGIPSAIYAIVVQMPIMFVSLLLITGLLYVFVPNSREPISTVSAYVISDISSSQRETTVTENQSVLPAETAETTQNTSENEQKSETVSPQDPSTSITDTSTDWSNLVYILMVLVGFGVAAFIGVYIINDTAKDLLRLTVRSRA